MDDSLLSIKNILATISAPLTFILGMVGWHYKSVVNKIEEVDKSTEKLQILVHEHNVHVNHLNDTVRKIENKVDFILSKLDRLA